MAVGKSSGPVAYQWDGKGWLKTPGPALGRSYYLYELYAVSCTGASDCMAVGQDLEHRTPLIEHWNGRKWEIQKGPSVGGGVLRGVSCVSGTDCHAVGSKPAKDPLAETWNGHEWKLTPTVKLHSPAPPQLNAVTCLASGPCEAVGSPDATAVHDAPLAEGWSGTSWRRQTTSNLPEAVGDHLLGVSCASPTWCMAVGEADSPTGTHAVIQRYL
jgi:hypothetical protein